MGAQTLTFAATDGTEIAAERVPGAGPPIVLLHAGVADRRAWREVAAELGARGGDVVAYDRRGFGETPAGTVAFRHVDDLLAVLEAAAGRPAWLVGNSQGGLVALDVALEAPERVAGLVLLAPAVSGAPEPDDDALDDATRRLVEEIDRAEAAGDLDAVNRLEVRLWLDGPAGPEGRVGGEARLLALAMNARALASEVPEGAGAGGVDAWARLAEVPAPVTIAWGALDLPVVVERCRLLAERLGDVRLAVELPGVAHLPALEQPDLVAGLIAEAVGLTEAR